MIMIYISSSFIFFHLSWTYVTDEDIKQIPRFQVLIYPTPPPLSAYNNQSNVVFFLSKYFRCYRVWLTYTEFRFFVPSAVTCYRMWLVSIALGSFLPTIIHHSFILSIVPSHQVPFPYTEHYSFTPNALHACLLYRLPIPLFLFRMPL